MHRRTIFGVLGYFPDTQAALLVGVVWVVVLVVSYRLWCKPRAGQGEPARDRAELHR